MNGLRGRSMRQRFLQSNPAARPHIVRLPSEGETTEKFGKDQRHKYQTISFLPCYRLCGW